MYTCLRAASAGNHFLRKEVGGKIDIQLAQEEQHRPSVATLLLLGFRQLRGY